MTEDLYDLQTSEHLLYIAVDLTHGVLLPFEIPTAVGHHASGNYKHYHCHQQHYPRKGQAVMQHYAEGKYDRDKG